MSESETDSGAVNRYEADIQSLVAFRDATVKYRGDVAVAMEQAQREIDRSLQRLESLRRDWQADVRRRTDSLIDCQRAAMLAAASEYGGYVDCSGYAAALAASQQRLAQMVGVQDAVQRSVAHYNRKRLEYGAYLDGSFARGQEYLRACIDNFSRFAQLKLMPPWIEKMIGHKAPYVPDEPSATGRLGPRYTGGLLGPSQFSGSSPEVRGGVEGIESGEIGESGSERRG